LSSHKEDDRAKSELARRLAGVDDTRVLQPANGWEIRVSQRAS
jgi:hypothetical protein